MLTFKGGRYTQEDKDFLREAVELALDTIGDEFCNDDCPNCPHKLPCKDLVNLRNHLIEFTPPIRKHRTRKSRTKTDC